MLDSAEKLNLNEHLIFVSVAIALLKGELLHYQSSLKYQTWQKKLHIRCA